LSPIQAVCVPADNFTAPAAVHTFLQISASIVLSRRRAGEGQYLAIAPNQA
jgi:F-type H+-transporting ATPase subunit beta